MAKRRLLFYPALADRRSLYCPRHAAPSLFIRVARRCSLALARAGRPHIAYAPPPHHRAAAVQPQWPRLTVVVIEAHQVSPRRLAPYPGFSAVPSRIAIRHI